MRKGRSGESPHGKNCGMKSRLADAVRYLVHACLTAATNVGALCMKGWRWMLGAFARTRTSAKRTLTNIEGVLVTLALIATLGIASPLAAGAIEPVEDPTPVSGVLDADDAQIADAADSDDVTDESDVADSDETAKVDTSADQDATEGDAADEATEDADADADASEKDASTDGEQSEDAVELEERAEEREGGVVSANKELADSRLGSRAVEPTNRTFLGDGGQLNLGYLFSRYNVIALENAELSHTIGPVLIGGDYNQSRSPINIGDGNDPKNPDNDKPKYRHEANSYIKGKIFKEENGTKSKTLTEVIPNNSSIDLFLGMVNQEFVTDEVAATIFDSSKNNGDVYLTDQYLIFSNLKEMASSEAERLKNSSDVIDTGLTIHANQWDNGRPVWSFAEAATNNAWQDGKKLVLKAGKSYIINADALSYMQDGSSIDKEIIIDASGVVGLDGKVYEGGDASKLPETVITVVGTGGENGVLLPGIAHVKYTVAGVEHTIQLENAIADGGKKEANSGLPLVWNLPDATKVTNMKSPAFGHVIAPEAEAHITGDYNGCWLVKTINADAEGHMWPYNGKRLSIHKTDTFNIQAHKSLIGRQLNNQEFTFEVYKAKNHWFKVSALDWIEWKENGLVGTKTNGADGNVNFDPIDITEEDFHSGWTIVDWASICSPDTNKSCSITKKFGYIVKEKVPDTRDPVITYDQTVFRVTVPATITFDYSVNSGDPDVTIVAGTPTYSLGSGNIADHLQEGKPHFINVADTTKLKIKKEIEGYDESKDSEVTFSFQVSLELPDGMSLKAADSSSTQPQKLFFDNMADPKNRTTYGYACVANDAKNGCKRSGESNVATRQEFYIPEGTTIVLPDNYAQQFRVEIESIQNTKRSRIKLIAKNTGNPPVVPSEISWPQLVVGSPSSTYVQCPSNPNKKCTQITLNVTGQGSAELEKLPLGTKYTITEQPSDDFSLVGFNGGTEQFASGELTGKDSSGNKIESITVTAKNKRKPKPVSLVIMKRVVDANTQEIREGLPDDAVFTIAINLYKEGSQNNRVPGEFDYKKTGDGQEEESGKLSCNADGCSPVTLKPWQTITITGLPEGTQFSVAETDAGGFEHVSTVVSKPATCASTFAAAQTACQLNDGAQGVVTVTNRYVTVVLPETGGKAHPFMTMLFGVGVVCAGLLITAIYMRRQGMAMLQ